MKLISILLLIIISHSCRSQEFESYANALIQIKKDFRYIPLDNWLVEQKIEYIDSLVFYKLYNENDTSYSLEFEIDNHIFSDSNDLKISISWFQKTFTDSLYKHTLILNKNDTLVHYKSKKKSEKEKNFVVGKYYYMYLFPKEFIQIGFTGEHMKYIHDHLDSLKLIRGDSIKLPF